jgi:hypothetical protein
VDMTLHVRPIKTQNNYIKKEIKTPTVPPTYCIAPHLLCRPCTRRRQRPPAAGLAPVRPPPARTPSHAAQPLPNPFATSSSSDRRGSISRLGELDERKEAAARRPLGRGCGGLCLASLTSPRRWRSNTAMAARPRSSRRWCPRQKARPWLGRSLGWPGTIGRLTAERGITGGGWDVHFASLFYIIIYCYSLIYFIFRDYTYVISSIFACLMIIREFTARLRILLEKGLSRYNISED